MENKNSYTIVGVFFVVCVFCISMFLLWMNARGNEDVYRSYYIQTQVLPNGIKDGSEVKFIGVPAGFVKRIYFSNLQNATIEIEVFVNDGLPIKKDSTAVVESQGITGISYINISKGSDEAEGFKDDEKAVIALTPGLIDKITSKADMLYENLINAFNSISLVLNDDNAKKINSILTILNSSISNLGSKDNIEKFNSIINSLDMIANNFENESSAMNGFFTKATKAVDSIDRLIYNINHTLAQLNTNQILIRQRIESDDYNLRAIAFPTLNQATNTMIEFQDVLREIKSMLFRLEDDPYKFFFKNTQKED
ncbi:MCE family protein [Campylobacter sp. RM12327]|uniref:MlaD family protein n=1 Tax=Campylobacter sputorum TaxID=206 RepID=UPI000B773BB0|nr:MULTISPECIES: MlaD family protein [Campylobacter]ASM39296.1 lipid asymmetry ABC transporter MlaABCDEF, periplasmic component MlaD [Campylobacter sputorum]MBE7358465.1 MCE family protein [Campylobacter sp. RM11302]MBF6669360.1 MCE family protein [Campylobacter sp. RM12327]MBF6674628.1 MCE family protein [Campylobacter sp. RM13538]MBF6676135.1 MCE family protein [Campylobacter sp. RM12321]